MDASAFNHGWPISGRQRASLWFAGICLAISLLGTPFYLGRISKTVEAPVPTYRPGQVDCDPGRMTLRVHPRADGSPVEVPINPCGFKS